VINVLTKMISPRVHAPVILSVVKEYKEGKDKRGRRYCTDDGKRVPCRGGPTPTPKVFLDSGPSASTEQEEKARPIDHLVAGVEVAEEANRDGNGFLDKEGQNAVLAAFQGMDDEDVDLSPGPSMKSLRMKWKSLRLLRERRG